MKPLSLKARAIALLAQREHSRSELQRKLLRIAQQQAEKEHQARREAGAEAHEADAEAEAESGAAGLADEVDTLLAWLEANRYLSEARFIESRINARAQRYGNLRIRQELSQHGVAPDASSQQLLKDSELDRARQVWQRKFGEIAGDAAARAKQMRFLAGRGFSAEVIRRVVRGADDE